MIQSLLKPEIKKWLQKSIESELYASNLYKHIANQLQRLGFFGAQKFFLHESGDELKHYQLIVDYLNDMGDVAAIPNIEAINDPILSIGTALSISYETELDLLNQYKEFYRIAEKNDDCVTGEFLLQFLKIQRNSVGEFGDFISRYQKCGMNEAAILEFDEFMEDKVS